MRSSLAFLAVLIGGASLQAQTVWNNPANDSSWTNPNNWSAGVPTSTSNVSIAAQPAEDVLGIDTNGQAVVASFTFDSSLTASVEVDRLFNQTLKVNGAITNNDDNAHTFVLPVFAGADATFAGGSAGLVFRDLFVGTNVIATSGAITIGKALTFDLNSATAYGQIGSVNVVAGTTININVSGYTASWGDTFDFTTGSFAGATLGALPTLEGDLSWDTTKFLSEGVLTVVPEPSTWALVALGGLAFVMVRLRAIRAAVPVPVRRRSRR